MSPSELIHFSAKPLRRVRNRAQDVLPCAKPNGLWLSCGEEWAEWCAAESFALDRFSFATRVELSPDANVLRIADSWALDRFARDYGEEMSSLPVSLPLRYQSIEWRRVASEYDGIIIAPYIWAARHRWLWYYGWDVASGCIWNRKAVASLECVALAAPLIRTEEAFRQQATG